jgi:hypothetical protein
MLWPTRRKAGKMVITDKSNLALEKDRMDALTAGGELV